MATILAKSMTFGEYKKEFKNKYGYEPADLYSDNSSGRIMIDDDNNNMMWLNDASFDYNDIHYRPKDIHIKYFSDKIPELQKIDIGDWIDVYAAEDVKLDTLESAIIPLGIGMILPNGYEAHLAPRSSTFKKFGIIQTNHVGIIDESYCGDNDQWMMSVVALRPTEIHVGDKIAQFRIVEKMPCINFIKVDHLADKDRGGFGSTGSR